MPAAEPATTVELAIGTPDLAERVRAALLEDLTKGRLAVATAATGHGPAVLITDAPERIAEALADGVPVLVLAEGRAAADALRGGATAVLSPDAGAPALCAGVRAAALGLTTLSAELRRHVLGDIDRHDIEVAAEMPAPGLTARELEVLRLLVEGASNKVIARQLGITPHTAKFHVAAIAAKLGASGRTDAVAKAISLGLVMV